MTKTEKNVQNHSQMLDKNGNPVKVGDRCKFWSGTRTEWRFGTVRRVQTHSYYNMFEQRDDVWEAKVDDGDPMNPDIESNGFSVAAHVESNAIEVLND